MERAFFRADRRRHRALRRHRRAAQRTDGAGVMNARAPSALAATAWAYAQGWTARGLSLLIFFLLARLLGPQDFGAFAIASIVLALAETVIEQGLGTALIQRNDLRREH